MNPRVLPQSGEQLGIHPGDSGGCLPEPLPIRVLPDGQENLADRPLDPLAIDPANRRPGRFVQFRHKTSGLRLRSAVRMHRHLQGSSTPPQ